MRIRNATFHTTCRKFSRASLKLVDKKVKSGALKIPVIRKEKIEIKGKGTVAGQEVIEPELTFLIHQAFDEISKLNEYTNCKKVMENNKVIKKHLNQLVGTLQSKSLITVDDSLRSLLTAQIIANKNFKFIEKTFNRTYSEMEQFFYRKKLKITILAFLENFESKAKEIKLAKNLSITKIEKEILEGLWPALRFQRIQALDIASIEFVIKMNFEAKKQIGEPKSIKALEIIEKSEESKAAKEVNEVAVALTVFKEGLFGSNLILFEPVGWRTNIGQYMTGSFRKRIYLGTKYEMSTSGAKKFKLFWKKFKARKAKPTDIAINRLRYAQERESPEDKLIDYIIGFESLLLKGEKKELSLRLALRTAVLLAKNNHERKKIQYEMRDAYNLRSSVVHGEKIKKSKEEAKEIIEKTEANLRLTILKFLTLVKRREHEKILHALDRSIFYKNLQLT